MSIITTNLKTSNIVVSALMGDYDPGENKPAPAVRFNAIQLPTANELETATDSGFRIGDMKTDYDPGENKPRTAVRNKRDAWTPGMPNDYEPGEPVVEPPKPEVLPGPPSKVARAYYRRRNKVFECCVCGLQVKNGIVGMQWHMKKHIRLGEAVGPLQEADVNDISGTDNGSDDEAA